VIFPILIAVGMQAINLIFNGFLSPILTLLAGCAVTALYAERRATARAAAAAQAAYPDLTRQPRMQGAAG